MQQAEAPQKVPVTCSYFPHLPLCGLSYLKSWQPPARQAAKFSQGLKAPQAASKLIILHGGAPAEGICIVFLPRSLASKCSSLSQPQVLIHNPAVCESSVCLLLCSFIQGWAAQRCGCPTNISLSLIIPDPLEMSACDSTASDFSQTSPLLSEYYLNSKQE